VKKNKFNLLSIALLSCLILLGSILEVHTNLANIDFQTSDSAKEIEDFSDSIVPFVVNFVPTLFFLELPNSVILSEQASHFHSTVPQLLCSNRIALPPPLLS
jgi:hypothetical protein